MRLVGDESFLQSDEFKLIVPTRKGQDVHAD